MSSWEDAWWESDTTGVARRDRRSGGYQTFVPDPLSALALRIPAELAQASGDTARAIRSLNGPGAESLASVARFLLRSEAIASSQIEGLSPSPKQVALAELDHRENVRGTSEQARLVANNMIVVREATTRLVEVDRVTVGDIVALHRALLPEQPALHGLRTQQNWIGGSSWHPLDADFVPPHPERVPALMGDLVDYLNGASHAPLIQAGLTHAQFETIHPFADGNGRVGRALIHTVLARSGLTATAVLPVSLVLATLRDTYVGGLNAFRHGRDSGDPAADRAVQQWLTVFVSAAQVATDQSRTLAAELAGLRDEWDERVSRHRRDHGVRPTPRSDSATARILAALAEAPVLTATTARTILGVSHPAAGAALDELHQAGVLSTRSIERNATAYLADEVLDLITSTERRLASTQFDTRLSPPNRSTPATPPGRAAGR